MNLPISRLLPLTALVAAFFFPSPLQAEVTLNAGAKDLKRIQINTSMVGYRDTLHFYIFEQEKAVLVVHIGNKNTEFPVSAKLHIFPRGTAVEGLEKWINNQHSDGLFPNVPEQEAVHEIPAGACKTKSHKLEENVEGVGLLEDKFSRYEVVFEIKDVPAFGDFKIKDFTDTATVYVKADVS